MTRPMFLAHVGIPLPIEGPFTYEIPEELAPRAEIGRRVTFPFRNKVRSGFIVDLNQETPVSTDLKSIIDIPEELPYFNANLWEFVCWIADYYMAPNGLVLKTALPPGSIRRAKEWVILTPEGRKWFGGKGDGSGVQLPMKLLKNGFMPAGDLEGLIGHEGIQAAVQKEWLRIEQRIARPRISLRKRRLVQLLDPAGASIPQSVAPVMTPDQERAVEKILQTLHPGSFQPFLLFGVTGSGKTEVYLRAIEETIRQGRKALVLVPEIALTPQLTNRFLRRLGGGLALFHSGLTPAQRLDEWRRIRAGNVNVVIGARSGVFSPIENLGLIVVDEEHDPSYKQEDSCPYNARDMALARGKLEGATVILGSATPSFETFVNARKGKIIRLDLPTRHHGGRMPEVRLVDLKEYSGKRSKSKALLTPPLVNAVRETLDRNEQVVLFLNRRGFDTFAQCKSCSHVFKCPNCDVSLTHHKAAHALRCHMCGFSCSAPPICPQCSSTTLYFGGVGTQKVEEEIACLFPSARIERLDRDSTRGFAELEAILDRFRKKEIDILTGTQMIVKGHDFPGISLVGVLCGDLSLHFPDFRAAERTFQMLTQVAGRTGRESDSGRVILQTFDPEHLAIQLAAAQEFERFFNQDSALREELMYPPFGHLILIRVEGNSEKKVEAKAIKIGKACRFLKEPGQDVIILGPAPAPRKKVVGKFRWQLLLKAPTRGPIRSLVKALKSEKALKSQGLKIIVDVDPVNLL
jgi:primosomal protein N' (replication factor Y) (superfamily II helicase)